MTGALVPTAALPAGLSGADRDRIEAALAAARSPATRRAYASQWRRWETWCAARGTCPLPAEPALVAAWLTELADAGRSASSVSQAASAISAAHLDASQDDPCATPGVRRVLAGIRRQVGTAPRRQAHPLSTDEIRRIITSIDRSTLRGQRDAAMILLGYAGALRRSELVALRVSDLAWRAQGIVISIRHSKSDQEGAGQLVGVARGQHAETDPVSALRCWIAAAELSGDDPVMCTIAWSDRRALRRPLSGEDVVRILRRRADDAGLGDLHVTGHSLRAGHATAAAEHGVPADRLARTTRHARLETLSHCVRPADALRDSSSRDLGL